MQKTAEEAPLNNPSLFPQGTHKSLITMAIGALVSWATYHALPYEPSASMGLAILVFIAILWFTEALHITVTAIIVPVLAAVSGIKGMDTKAALAGFADPIIYIFFGGFALATALHVQKLDRKIALWLISLSRGSLLIAVMALFCVTSFLSIGIGGSPLGCTPATPPGMRVRTGRFERTFRMMPDGAGQDCRTMTGSARC